MNAYDPTEQEVTAAYDWLMRSRTRPQLLAVAALARVERSLDAAAEADTDEARTTYVRRARAYCAAHSRLLGLPAAETP